MKADPCGEGSAPSRHAQRHADSPPQQHQGSISGIVTDGSLQLAAGHDITIRQAEVKAGGDLIAAAGHDLNVTSVLGESRTVTDHMRQGKNQVTTK
ncbi:hemagglutinin repeat-containing protein [Xanthomonas translucens]|uniref:hemagglutinin repeat-containing protein n=1 Tax=Xanthomonas campestris pv. translucens TaxID=343 RepID=UPI000A5C14BD|nr:hemagglutinin repeat-containing protein [Xanthomonas translucens]UPU49574.1 hemagglutinin repeat-containing protein [Xanthomonas translucens pv. undulosa]WLA04743.1 hemagglutinin repeat-containing protein [Xanthomonas translucens]